MRKLEILNPSEQNRKVWLEQEGKSVVVWCGSVAYREPICRIIENDDGSFLIIPFSLTTKIEKPQ